MSAHLDVAVEADAAALSFGEGEEFVGKHQSREVQFLEPGAPSSSRTATLRVASAKRRWWRRRASTQRRMMCTPTSTLAFVARLVGPGRNRSAVLATLREPAAKPGPFQRQRYPDPGLGVDEELPAQGRRHAARFSCTVGGRRPQRRRWISMANGSPTTCTGASRTPSQGSTTSVGAGKPSSASWHTPPWRTATGSSKRAASTKRMSTPSAPRSWPRSRNELTDQTASRLKPTRVTMPTPS